MREWDAPSRSSASPAAWTPGADSSFRHPRILPMVPLAHASRVAAARRERRDEMIVELDLHSGAMTLTTRSLSNGVKFSSPALKLITDMEQHGVRFQSSRKLLQRTARGNATEKRSPKSAGSLSRRPRPHGHPAAIEKAEARGAGALWLLSRTFMERRRRAAPTCSFAFRSLRRSFSPRPSCSRKRRQRRSGSPRRSLRRSRSWKMRFRRRRRRWRRRRRRRPQRLRRR